MTATVGISPRERLCLDALSRLDCDEGRWALAVLGVHFDIPLTDMMRSYLFQSIDSCRRQLPGEVAALGSAGQKLLAAERAGYEAAGLAFEVALHDDPDAWDTRLVYADFLEEQGQDVLAAGQRWQAENKKRPVWYWCHGGDDVRVGHYWVWNPNSGFGRFPVAESLVPIGLWAEMGTWHTTRHEAEAALARVLAGGEV